MTYPRILFYSVFVISVFFILNSQLLSGAVVKIPANQGFTSQWPDTDFSRSSIDLSEVTSGGPPKDGIPAIDKPVFVSAQQASAWLHANEPVIAVEINGKARAYPLQILIYHEIVNDSFAGVPLSVTFCPLCNASIVFDRRLGDQVLDFGTTGNLRKSDLVMYDRQTQSWWQQFTGEGIVGRYTGKMLTQLPSKIVSFSQFTTTYPAAMVLSRQTGHRRPYGSNPYRGYDRVGDTPFLFSDPLDNRLPAMERVIGIQSETKSGSNKQVALRLYPFSVLENKAMLHDSIAELPVVIFVRDGLLSVLDQARISNSRSILSAVAYDRRVSGRELTFRLHDGVIQDIETGSHWNLFGQATHGPLLGEQLVSVDKGVHFAFAWLAFYPGAEIYSGSRN